MKLLCINTVMFLLPASATPAKERYSVVVPTKFITYTVSILPPVLQLCHLFLSFLSLSLSLPPKHHNGEYDSFHNFIN